MYKNVLILNGYGMRLFHTQFEIHCSNKLAWWACVSNPFFSHTSLLELQWQIPQKEVCFSEFIAKVFRQPPFFLPYHKQPIKPMGDPLLHWKESYQSGHWYHHWTVPHKQILASLHLICCANRSIWGWFTFIESSFLIVETLMENQTTISYVWRWLERFLCAWEN